MSNIHRQIERAKAAAKASPKPERLPSAERVAAARDAIAAPGKDGGLAQAELEAVVEVLRGVDRDGLLAAKVLAALRSSRAAYLKAYRDKKRKKVPF